MNRLGKLVVGMGLLPLLSALPLAAQIDDDGGVTFTTKFAFYAGSAKLPAGSYKVSQPNMDVNVLRVTSTNSTKSVFVNFTPTESLQPSGKSDVTFHQYGDSNYLDRVSIAGQLSGAMLDRTKAEVKAAANANASDASTVSSGQ